MDKALTFKSWILKVTKNAFRFKIKLVDNFKSGDAIPADSVWWFCLAIRLSSRASPNLNFFKRLNSFNESFELNEFILHNQGIAY